MRLKSGALFFEGSAIQFVLKDASYWGENHTFDYSSFKVDMPKIDSMRFKVKEFNPTPGERAALVDVQTVLQDLQGQLSIDMPDNKSSRKYYPEYPIFEALNNSYVYYDDRKIHNGVYDRSRFYMAKLSLRPGSSNSFSITPSLTTMA